jgi:hypothetical protein
MPEGLGSKRVIITKDSDNEEISVQRETWTELGTWTRLDPSPAWVYDDGTYMRTMSIDRAITRAKELLNG